MKFLHYLKLGVLNILIVIGAIAAFAVVVYLCLFLGAQLIDAGHPILGFGWYVFVLVGMGTWVAYEEEKPYDSGY
jgi:hypothetical protein